MITENLLYAQERFFTKKNFILFAASSIGKNSNRKGLTALIDYSVLDNPFLLRNIFYPYPEVTPCPPGAVDIFVPVEKDVSISCRFHAKEKSWPNILFFHGNGELVGDYDDIAPFYNKKGLNIMVVDYRGYGASGGFPKFSSMINDAHSVFDEFKKILLQQDYNGGLWVMGRSLGSASALDLAYHCQDQIKGLIIESGFPSFGRLLKRKGIVPPITSLDAFNDACLTRLGKIFLPALVMHGQYDSLVPLQEAQDLFDGLGSPAKKMIIIPDADHNTTMMIGFDLYFNYIKEFIES